MSNPIRSTWRRATGRLVAVAFVGVCCLTVIPTASAAARPKVHAHLRRATRALEMIASGKVSGNVTVSLSQLTTQLNGAAKIGVNLAVNADTPDLKATAAQILTQVTNVEAKADGVLNAALPAVSGAALDAVLKADLEVNQAEALDLQALVDLGVDTRAEVGAIENTIDTVSATAKDLLTELVSATMPGCVSVSTSVAGDIPASVAAELDPVSVTLPVIGTIVNSNGSLLAGLVSHETADTQAAVSVGVGCDGSTGATAGILGSIGL